MIDMLRIKRRVDTRGNVASVDEIARLLAIAVNRQAFALSQTFGENADDAAFAAISLTLTVDIGKTQNDKVEAKRLLIQAQIMFDRDF